MISFMIVSRYGHNMGRKLDEKYSISPVRDDTPYAHVWDVKTCLELHRLYIANSSNLISLFGG